jgi:hypothetical protein
VLGAIVAIDIQAVDETNTRVRIKDIIANIKRNDGFGLVGLVGVQSNQFPRALDIARPLRAAGAFNVGISHLTATLYRFSRAVELEVVHPLQAGLFRPKHRQDRRYGMPIESAWAFHPKLVWEIVSKHARMIVYWLRLEIIRRRVLTGEARRFYTDTALTAVDDDETETFEMFTHNEGARTEVVRTRRIAELTSGARKSLADA